MNEFSVLIEAFIRKKQESKNVEFSPVEWLDSASKRASQIRVATHVLKFTNSDAKGTNICVKAPSAHREFRFRYVTTEEALPEVRKDVVGNAAAMDVAAFLQLEVNGVALLDLIAKNDTAPLSYFAESESRLKLWMDGFRSVLFDGEPTSHTLAKQIYFPLENDGYHLLSPLYPSSLSQALYDRIHDSLFGEGAKKARECRKNGNYFDADIINYPNLAVQKFGGTKPQNISRLNSLRGGKSYLISCAPPHWKSEIATPPMKRHSFWKNFKRTVYFDLKEFERFLKSLKNRKNKNIKYQIRLYVKHFVQRLMEFAGKIQFLEPGWSINSDIPIHEKIWLDPFYQDFEEVRDREPWKESVSKSFATWLARILKNESKHLSDNDHKYLSSVCLKELERIEK